MERAESSVVLANILRTTPYMACVPAPPRRRLLPPRRRPPRPALLADTAHGMPRDKTHLMRRRSFRRLCSYVASFTIGVIAPESHGIYLFCGGTVPTAAPARPAAARDAAPICARVVSGCLAVVPQQL